nr:alpha/beta hydrolase-fold protein [Leeuwenhoekiella sp. MAR_2009_132]
MYSTHLKEYRKHNVYLPKDFDPVQNYPIIYATDGSRKTEGSFFKKTLDSLIQNNIIKPVLYVGSHSNSKIADSTSRTTGDGSKFYMQFRNFEYVDNKPSRIQDSMVVDRFPNHMLYFTEELIPTVEKEFNQKLTKEDRYFYGVSNGAGFGMSMLNMHPDLVGTYLCFSTFGGAIRRSEWKKDVSYPDLFLIYGSEEFEFLKKDAEFLKSKYNELNGDAEIREFDGGHDYKVWNREFTNTISELLKKE